jgi:hypothetical protein
MSASAIPSAPITFAVPFRIGEMNVGPDEVVDGEVVFAVVEAGAASDDLLELDHLICLNSIIVPIGRIKTILRMLRASTPVESFCEVVRMVGMVFSLS